MLLASAERHFFKQRRRNSRWVDQRSAPVQPQHAVAEVGHSARAQALKIAMFAAILQGGVARASSMLATRSRQALAERRTRQFLLLGGSRRIAAALVYPGLPELFEISFQFPRCWNSV